MTPKKETTRKSGTPVRSPAGTKPQPHPGFRAGDRPGRSGESGRVVPVTTEDETEDVESEAELVDDQDENENENEEGIGRGNRPNQQRDHGQNRGSIDATRQRESSGQGAVRHRKAP